MHLDDRLYLLKKPQLPEVLTKLLHNADVLFLQDKEKRTKVIVAQIEWECRVRAVPIHKDEFM